MFNRIAIVVGIIAVMALWLGPYPVPGWAVVALVLVMLPMGIAISVKRVRAEQRLIRTFWKALTGR